MRTSPLVVAACAAAVGLFAQSPTAGAQTVNLAGCSSWSINNNVFTCTATNPGSNLTAPSNCAVVVNPPSASAATLVNVYVACAGGAPTQFSWTGGFMQGQTAAQGSGTLSATTQFSVVASNSAGSDQQRSGSFTLTSSTPPPTGGGGQMPGGVSCPGFSTTTVVPTGWTTPNVTVRKISSTFGPFGTNGALIVKFTTPMRDGPGRIAIAEYGSAPTQRTAILSSTWCDWNPQTVNWQSTGVSNTMYFTVGPNSRGWPQLAQGTTYYLNVKNELAGMPMCVAGACDVFIDIKGP